jgi:hypothetical protein
MPSSSTSRTSPWAGPRISTMSLPHSLTEQRAALSSPALIGR